MGTLLSFGINFIMIVLEYMDGCLQCVNPQCLEDPRLQKSIQSKIIKYGLRNLDISKFTDYSDYVNRLALAAATVKR
jgi:hypothetical protein